MCLNMAYRNLQSVMTKVRLFLFNHQKYISTSENFSELVVVLKIKTIYLHQEMWGKYLIIAVSEWSEYSGKLEMQ